MKHTAQESTGMDWVPPMYYCTGCDVKGPADVLRLHLVEVRRNEMASEMLTALQEANGILE